MALFQHMVIPWLFGFVFFILLALKLEKKLAANWFVTFVPLFILDFIQMIIIMVRLIIHIRSGRIADNQNVSKRRKCWDLFVWMCLALFQVLICLKLDVIIPALKLYYVLIPLWIVLIGYNIDFMRYQILVIRRG